MEPPGLIKLEKEIEQEEKAPLPPPSSVSPAQPLPPSPSSSPSPSLSPSPTPPKVISSKKSTGNLLDDAVSHHIMYDLASNFDLRGETVVTFIFSPMCVTGKTYR